MYGRSSSAAVIGFQAVGKFQDRMKFKDHDSKEEIFVFDGDRHPLLGRQTMASWGLKIDFCAMSATEDHYKKLEEILDKHEAVFTCELGRLKDVKVCLPLKEEVVLKFCKPRKVPLAFKEEVEDELDRLERTGIITAASTADVEWGNAISTRS